MANGKQNKLVVPCRNRVAHTGEVHLIPIPQRFKTPTDVRCDLCGRLSKYLPSEILAQFANKPIVR